MRHRVPLITWLIALSAWWLLGLTLDGSPALVLTVVVSLFACGRYGPRRSVFVVVPATMGSVILVTVAQPATGTPAQALGWSLNALWIFGLGMWLGQKDELVAMADVEAMRKMQHAMTQERLHLARELHDILANSMSVMVVQAEAAEELLSTDLVGARVAIENVQDAGRSALDETRDLVGSLRLDQTLTSGAHDLNDGPAVADRMRVAGLTVSTNIDVDCELSPALSATTFRIVQEALTNVLRHAGPGTRVAVTVRRSDGELEVTVIDDGAPQREIVPGSGLRGMRERVERSGGTLLATATERGFEVRAALPLATTQLTPVAGGRS
jgi:signal transduction histidine kinase